jgi:3-deoxy-D-manno-octulosonate 8-phosphate phosphatase KdsC-like HAD superfamily phosphatase
VSTSLPSRAEIESRLARVRLLLLDVDGVLTDGSVTWSSEGHELKTFHVRDGLGPGPKGDDLGIDIVRQGVGDKLAAAAEVIGTCGLSWEESAFVGDDLPDLPVVRKCGVGVAVADACPELRAAAVLVTERVGGRGAVREVVERLLRARGEWEAAVAGYRGGVA